MLTIRQLIILCVMAVLFWVAALAWIRFFPDQIVDPLRGDLGFLASIPVCWLCILVARRGAALGPAQLVPGTAVVVAVATLIDAAALRWLPALYSGDEQVCRLGAAWLLWGYGLSLGIALLMQYRSADVRVGMRAPGADMVPGA